MTYLSTNDPEQLRAVIAGIDACRLACEQFNRADGKFAQMDGPYGGADAALRSALSLLLCGDDAAEDWIINAMVDGGNTFAEAYAIYAHEQVADALSKAKDTADDFEHALALIRGAA